LIRNTYPQNAVINPGNYEDENAMSEVQWFYVNAQQEKIGPVPAAAVAQAYARGQMRLDSLVWAAHLPKWQALSEHLQTFGINTKPPDTTRLLGGEEVKYAHFIHRWAAHLFDTWLLNLAVLVIVGGILLIAYFAMGPRFGPLNVNTDETLAVGIMFPMFAMFGYFLFYPLLSGAYHTYLEGPQKHGSFGKRFLGIAIVTDKGGPMDYGKAFARWFSSIVSHMTQSIGFVIAAFTPRRQALHDYIVGTLVVESPNPRYAGILRNNRATWAIILCVLVFPILLTAAIVIPAFIIIKKAEELKVSAFNEVNTAITPVKAAVTAYYEKNASCPDQTEPTLAAVLGALKTKTTSVTIGETSDQDGCEIYATYGTGRYVWYRMDADKQWTYEVETSNSFDSAYNDVQPVVDDVAAAPVEELSAVEQAQASAAAAAMRAEVAAAAEPIKALVQALYTKDGRCLTNDDKALADVIGALKDKSTNVIIGPVEEVIEGCEIYVEFGDAQYLWYRINQDKQWSEETDETNAETE
jgi:uncharacterized RDD family membrane protein YckC